jgi:four helix bundle protein
MNEQSDNSNSQPGNLAQSFLELDVYQECCALDFAIFEITKTWPKEEMYSLTDQIRRSSRSVGANIAEGWAKRRYPAHFTSKLTDADGELQETRHWLRRAQAYSYIDQQTLVRLDADCQRIGRRLGAMFKAGNWC